MNILDNKLVRTLQLKKYEYSIVVYTSMHVNHAGKWTVQKYSEEYWQISTFKIKDPTFSGSSVELLVHFTTYAWCHILSATCHALGAHF